MNIFHWCHSAGWHWWPLTPNQNHTRSVVSQHSSLSILVTHLYLLLDKFQATQKVSEICRDSWESMELVFSRQFQKKWSWRGKKSVIEKKKMTRSKVCTYPTLLSHAPTLWSGQVYNCVISWVFTILCLWVVCLGQREKGKGAGRSRWEWRRAILCLWATFGLEFESLRGYKGEDEMIPISQKCLLPFRGEGGIQ